MMMKLEKIWEKDGKVSKLKSTDQSFNSAILSSSWQAILLTTSKNLPSDSIKMITNISSLAIILNLNSTHRLRTKRYKCRYKFLEYQRINDALNSLISLLSRVKVLWLKKNFVVTNLSPISCKYVTMKLCQCSMTPRTTKSDSKGSELDYLRNYCTVKTYFYFHIMQENTPYFYSSLILFWKIV